MTMDVRSIVEVYLRENGYDGLYDDYECACVLGDLFPCCREGVQNCMPGHKVLTPDGEYDWLIYPGKRPEIEATTVQDSLVHDMDTILDAFDKLGPEFETVLRGSGWNLDRIAKGLG